MSGKPKARGHELLRRALDEREMSQAALERAVDASKGLATRWLAGDRVPDLKFAVAIERLLGVPVCAWVDAGTSASTEG